MNPDIAYKILMIRRLREAGQVKRCHALVHNDPGYTDGKHSFDAVSMLLILHPNPSMSLVKYMLWHDMAERWAGDLPASAKWSAPDLHIAYEQFEWKVMDSMLPMVSAANAALTLEDRRWVRAMDLLEFAMWVEDQLAIGNQHVRQAKINIMEAIINATDPSTEEKRRFPDEVIAFVSNYGLEWTRLPERIDR